MGKVIILNLSNIDIKGDILDVGESYGVIYNLSKEIDEEVSVDYVESENSKDLFGRNYDNSTMFFSLSSIWGNNSREHLIKMISKSLKPGGCLYIWDINKELGEIINSTIRAILPSGNIKEFEFKNLNLVSTSNIEDTKGMLNQDFRVVEEKMWEDIYYIKAEKVI